MHFKKRAGSQAGFSLLEVLIALAITGIITAAMFKTYVVQHQNYLTQDSITNLQQSARAVIDELAKHVRMAGNQVPGQLSSLSGSDSNPDTITVVYKADDCLTSLSANMTSTAGGIACSDDPSCFDIGRWVYIYHPDSANGEWFCIAAKQTSAPYTVTATDALSKSYAAGSIITTMQRAKFFIDNTTDTDNPKLMVEVPGQIPIIYADHINDLQLQYRLKNGLVVDNPVTVTEVREVMISVTGRSERSGMGVAGDDYQYRTYNTSINLRNF